jgi:hypothetical protein
MTISRCIIVRMRNVSDKVVEKIKTHILCPVPFFSKSYRLRDNGGKYGRDGQATYENIL